MGDSDHWPTPPAGMPRGDDIAVSVVECDAVWSVPAELPRRWRDRHIVGAARGQRAQDPLPCQGALPHPLPCPLGGRGEDERRSPVTGQIVADHAWLRRVSDYHSGGVWEAERAAVEAHLATC